MNQELDYAEMLEIPVNTVNVVKKKSFFKRKQAVQPAPQPEELKEMVVESVNERVGAYVYAEDLSDAPKPEKVKFRRKVSDAAAALKDKGGKVLFIEAVAIGLIAIAIFITNVFMPTSAINTFLGLFTGTANAEAEPTYSELKLSAVVSDFSDAEVFVSDSGVISFTAEGSVYPVYGGTVSRVYEEDGGLYTVEIAHTSNFTSVITGLTHAYYDVNTKLAANLPMGYSDGTSEVRVSLYNGGELLNCFTLMDEVPVWVS
ncbi:MAG: hypothetical protein K2J83_06020 [Clostridia bacterium]|nr:hypothetical protein [Clostridia bacterium]